MLLKFGFIFKDLNSLSGLQKLDETFLQWIQEQDNELAAKLKGYRLIGSGTIDSIAHSEFLLQLAPFVDDFIAELFNIEKETQDLKKKHEKFDPIYECRRKFVQRYAVKQYPKENLAELDFAKITTSIKQLIGAISELSLAKSIMEWQKDPDTHQNELTIAAQYCAFMVALGSSLTLFDLPKAVDVNNHLSKHKIDLLSREIYLGFNHRDHSNSLGKAYAMAKYCIYCHKQKKDSCSKGLEPEKTGCPLKQKISEMNLLKSQGLSIAALSVIVIDNPLVAATGHRICNDCMKACIFQKQDPVNIPLVESNILEQVLGLPWGAEIYLLLTKWNPLNIDAPLPLSLSGYSVLITGMGPAGFALSHYLLNEGHKVTAIDGLKISPLHFDIKKPIKYWQEMTIALSTKLPQGFGGVMEYGITNRWDKNNLTLVRLILERRENFNIRGGIRLGSNLTVEQAFERGFDHIALCIGTGKPRYDNLPGYFAKGVRSAADFLMNLQQGVAYHKDSNAKLLVRAPFVVIGCGLTAIDSATELMHYYPVMVENFLVNWERSEAPLKNLNPDDLRIAEEFINHAQLFRKAVNDAEKLRIMQSLGGITICYRKSIKESPAYKLNPEEIEHALALGIKFKENISPKAISTDEFGYTKSIEFTNGTVISAKSVLIAIGTDNNEFQDIDYNKHGISRFGDCNPKYAGSVVRALASAKNAYKTISQTMSRHKPKHYTDQSVDLKTTIVKVNILSKDIVELIVHSPLAVQNFKPGQFFKLQNYSSDINKLMEPLALTGAYIDRQENTISLIILEMGASSKLCRNLKEQDEIILMGPSGTPTKIVKNKNVALVGGGLGNAVLLAVGQALKANNCNVTYFAGYKKLQDRFYHEKIEQVAHQVFWACQEDILSKSREHDFSIKGNIIDAIRYGKNTGSLAKIEHVICIGSNTMMQTVAAKKIELFGSARMICSLNSPMQCMMKGICGQCLQKVDDERGYIFSCAAQDQDSDIVDFEVLRDRLGANSLLEKMIL
jgi:NADPH-dependent glutamate synthase beta subunit-like oxidoreductase/NAD(P)H-flavin reductase